MRLFAFHIVQTNLEKGIDPSILPPAMGILYGRKGSCMAVNLGEINSVKCHLKIDIVLYPTRAERLGKDLQEAPYSHWIVQGIAPKLVPLLYFHRNYSIHREPHIPIR